MRPAERRREIHNLEARFAVSERRALRVAGWPRSTHRHKSRAEDQAPLRMRLRELAAARPRYGYRRQTVLLRREGWHVNAKRVYRLYPEEGLTVRIRRRKKLASQTRVRPDPSSRVNDRWSMDFVADALSDGRKIRVLTVIDSFTRECLTLKIARSLPSQAVTEELDRVIAKRGQPRTIQVDNVLSAESRVDLARIAPFRSLMSLDRSNSKRIPAASAA